MASAEGTAGLNRANIGQTTGQNIAQMQYGTGQDLAAGRTRVGEIQANQLQQAAMNQSRLLEGLGSFQSNLIGGQAGSLIDLQNQAAVNAANQATGLASGISGLQTGLAGGQNAAYQNATRINAPSFDYGQALNAAAGGYSLGGQMAGQPRAGGYAPVSTSQPSYIRPNYSVPYQVPGATYNAGLGRFN
jgi:hypothetical protein